MDSSVIGIERRGPVCVLTLRRPDKLNALSYAVEEALAAALSSEERADEPRRRASPGRVAPSRRVRT